MKSAVGRAFLGFYGEQMLRSDLSVSVGELGSLNDHSGPVGEAERYAARVFGADQTFFVVGGSSASNQIILRSAVADGDIALVDRNCHKSELRAERERRRSGSTPAPARPRGVIGSVDRARARDDPQEARGEPAGRDRNRAVIAALTNSTTVHDVEHDQLLSQSVAASTTTRPGTPTRASTRSTRAATACTAATARPTTRR